MIKTGTNEAPLTSQDWNELWNVKQSLHQLNHDADFWNSRAKSFTNKDTPGSYTDRFLALADIKPGDSVFDMGCGTGNLSIPLARNGHKVLSADFSTAMLAQLTKRIEEEGLKDICVRELSWEDDWEKAGIEPDSFDVCIASRSIITHDIRESLLKLSSVARRYVCITLSCDSSPRIDDRAMRDIGLRVHPSYDDAYTLAILQGEGFYPKVDYIETDRVDIFDDFDAAMEKYSHMVEASIAQYGSDISKDVALDRLDEWLHDNLVKMPIPDGREGLALENPRTATWAFMSWEV